MKLNEVLKLRKLYKLDKKIVDEVKKPIKAYNGDELAYKLTRRAVVNFFKKNPNPTDKQLHKWAEKNKFDPHDVEEIVYKLTTKHIQMQKAKYTKRWKGKDGKWHYEYSIPSNKVKTKKVSHTFDAHKEGWKDLHGADKKAVNISKENPDKYITITVDFHIVNIAIHSKLPSSVYAPDDFKRGYWKDGKHFDWSEKRKDRASMVGLGVSN